VKHRGAAAGLSRKRTARKNASRTQAAAILGINRATLYEKRPAEAKE
jgi:hypothetical protein